MKKKTYAVTVVFLAIVLVAILAVFLLRVKGMESQMAKMQEALYQANTLESRLAESEAFVSAVRSERDAVNVVLSSIQAERDAANETLDSVQAERDAANAIAEAAKTERDIVYKRLNEAYTRIIELETEMGISPTTAPYVLDAPALVEPTEVPEAAEESAEPEVTEEVKAEETVVPEVTEEVKAEESAEPEAAEEVKTEETAGAAADDAEQAADKTVVIKGVKTE